MFVRSFCSRAGTAARCTRSTMPLRAKIINPAFGLKAQLSTESSTSTGLNPRSESIRELPGDSKEDVLFDTLFGIRTIDLNRPQKLHSLNGSMIRKIIPRLQEWAKSDMANVVVIKGTGPKAFCAGGDVASLAEDNKLGEEGQKRSTDYFGLEYKLDHLIANYTKPFVAFMDGITMGGGVGLSIHAPFRIATERTVFAMPETTIGFFPDVGASFFLPRMPGGVGTYLALTSEKLKSANVFYSGVATHFIHSTTLPMLERRLSELRFGDEDALADRLELVNATIEEYCTGLPHDEPILLGGEIRKAIDRCFTLDTVPEVLAALKQEVATAEEAITEATEQGASNETAQELRAWAEKTLKTIHQRSPTSVYVTLRQMHLGKNWSIAETFQREHGIAGKFMRHPDFTEGVDALLIRKTGNPQWQPASLEDVKPSDDVASPFFDIEGEQRLQLLSQDDFKEYPWAKFGIPQEKEVKQVWLQSSQSVKKVADHFVQQRQGKQGVREVVTEILQRRGQKQDGKAIWV